MVIKYTPSHEWIRFEGDLGFVGITSYAKKELGEIVYVELPTLGRHVEAGEESVVLESTKAAADIYAPVPGEIVEVNSAVLQDLTLLNQDPEGNGWLFKIAVSSFQEDSVVLLDQKSYEDMIHS